MLIDGFWLSAFDLLFPNLDGNDGKMHSRGLQAIANAPPASLFVGSAVFHYLGPAFAVLLFARLEPPGVAWLRIASAAAVFAAWRKPWRAFAALDQDGRRLVAAMGAVLAMMNVCFYLAIDRLPLGTVGRSSSSR